jgi:ribonuclease Z
MVRQLEKDGYLLVGDKKVTLDDVSWVQHGDSFAIVIDTLPCPNATFLARNASLLLCESTYLDEHAELARAHRHLTVSQAATIAKEAKAKQLILTHFSARYLNLRDFQTAARKIFPETHVADDLLVFPFPKGS